MSIYDELDKLDSRYKNDELLDVIQDVAKNVSRLNDGVSRLIKDITNIQTDLKDKTFNEIEDFLENLVSGLEDINNDLY